MRLIDADKLLEVIVKRKRPENGADCSKERYRYMQWLADYWAIKEAPTVDAVEVGHGEWTEKEVIQDKVIEEWQSARCSNCGKYHTTPYMYYFDDFDFCPNCGARMKGANNE